MNKIIVNMCKEIGWIMSNLEVNMYNFACEFLSNEKG